MTVTPPIPAPGDGPPLSVLPRFIGPSASLVDAGDFAAAVGGVRVYPAGIVFTLAIRSTRPGLELDFGGPPVGEGYEPLLMHAELADGHTVTADYLAPPFAPAGIRDWLGGGGGGRWDHDYWLWPLPADGKLTVRMEIPSLGIAGSASVDLGDVAALAARARSL